MIQLLTHHTCYVIHASSKRETGVGSSFEARVTSKRVECGEFRVAGHSLITEITSSHSSWHDSRWKKREFSALRSIASVS